MGKLRLLLSLSGPILLFGVLFGGMAIAVMLGMFVYFDSPKFMTVAANSTLAMICPVCLMGACDKLSRTMDCMRTVGPLTHGYNMHLLPMSSLCKYLVVLLLAFVMCFSFVMISLLVETVGSVLTASNSPEKQIVVGGMIRYFAENGIFPLILAEVSVALCAGTLFRTTWCVMLADIVVIVICSFINAFYFAFDKPMSLSLSECGVCLIIAVVCLVSGYQIFKRWQTANNGILMI